MNIRLATLQDHKVLTEISFSSKKYWNYPDSYFEIWKDELTITIDYILNNHVVVVENHDDTIGYYSVVILNQNLSLPGFKMKKGVWLDHVFIKPEYIGQGFGSMLMIYLVEDAKMNGWQKLRILVDPNSIGFYKKLGASFIEEVPSNIKGRTVSYLTWEIIKTNNAIQTEVKNRGDIGLAIE